MKMKIVFALFFAISICTTAHAEIGEKIQQLLKIMKVNEQLTQTLKDMRETQLANMRSQGATAQDLATQERMFEILTRHLSWKNLEGDYIATYKTIFTEQDIDALIAFYKTPVGQKLADSMPEIIAQTAEISQKHMREAMPEIKVLMDNYSKTQSR